jgi:putative transposase
MRTSVSRYPRHRFPTEIISHCVWLYFRFALSFRDVEEMMASRGAGARRNALRAVRRELSLSSWLRFRIDVGAPANINARISHLAEGETASLKTLTAAGAPGRSSTCGQGTPQL